MTNPIRVCHACRQTDDHPRCVHVLPDGRDALYHFDCCALLNCEHAQERIKGLKKGSIGEDMRAHLTKDWNED